MLKRLFRKIFLTKCKYCEKGRIRLSHEEPINHVWISVYECDHCGYKMV